MIEECVKRTESPDQNDALFSRKSSHSYSSRGRNQFYGGNRYNNNPRDNGARNQRRSNRPSQMQGVKCFKCQKFGHIVKNCPLNKRPNESNITEEKSKFKVEMME